MPKYTVYATIKVPVKTEVEAENAEDAETKVEDRALAEFKDVSIGEFFVKDHDAEDEEEINILDVIGDDDDCDDE